MLDDDENNIIMVLLTYQKCKYEDPDVLHYWSTQLEKRIENLELGSLIDLDDVNHLGESNPRYVLVYSVL